MFQSGKKAVFPFIGFGLFDTEGLGAATRMGVSPVPLIPQKAVRLPLQSFSVKGEEEKTFKATFFLK
ncbi:hypothetical protein [Bacillus sp. P14.5]|uniref:hypothetical protein n=1 Tax=Bacillus sp. P14.5 TaxID=1983400 RepID=UPI000DEB12C2|nr:hypothetical protein [Bacillus sp. P14.5]